MGIIMDNAIFKTLIEQRVKQPVEHTYINGLRIEAFNWADYSLTLHHGCMGGTVAIYLFKDSEELFFSEFVLSSKTSSKSLFELIVVPNVPEFFDDVESNDMADNCYLGNNVWAVKVVEEMPFEQFDIVTGSFYSVDTALELDNQDTADFIGFAQFDQDLTDADFEDNMTAWAEIDLEITLEQLGYAQ